MEVRRARWTGVAAAGAVAAGLAGGFVGLGGAAAGAATSHAAKVKPNIAFFGYATANAYTQAALKGVKAEAAKVGGSVTFFDSNMSSTTQVAQIEDATASGKYNALVVYSDDGNAVVPAVKEAIAKKIKVVADFVPIGPSIDTTKSQVPGLVGSSVIPIDSTGTAAGDLIVKACAGKSNCQVAYMPGDNTLPLEIDRSNAMEKVVKAHKNIDLLPLVEGGYTPASGEAATENILSAHPNINVLASSADQAIVGSVLALKAKGVKPGTVKLVGGGGTFQAVAGIKDGSWFGTVNYCPTTEANVATTMAVDALEGTKIKKNAINSATICGAPQALDKANLGKYKGQWSAG
jgi:ribose transport system substrate-binding protein